MPLSQRRFVEVLLIRNIYKLLLIKGLLARDKRAICPHPSPLAEGERTSVGTAGVEHQQGSAHGLDIVDAEYLYLLTGQSQGGSDGARQRVGVGIGSHLANKAL